MKRAIVLVFAAAVVFTGCTNSVTAHSLRAEKVLLTKNASDVTDCKFLGEVKSKNLHGEGHDEMKNKAFDLGADVVLFSHSFFGPESGKAYDCGGRYSRPAQTPQ